MSVDNLPWYYAEGGAHRGPVTAAELRALLGSGRIGRETLVWTTGMPDWLPASQTPLGAPAPGFAPGLPQANRLPPGYGPTSGFGSPGWGAVPPGRAPDFGEAIKICLSKYVVWAGRATRSEFWWFYLFTMLLSLLASVLDAVIAGGNNLTPVSSLVSLGLFLPQLSASVRRLHDTDRSAWWVLLPVLCILVAAGVGTALALSDASGPAFLILAVPVLGIFWPLIYFCQRGTAGPNRYGPDPFG